MSAKTDHLQMLQRVITRMAQNSFVIKGWSVTIVAAFFALAAADSARLFALLAYFPAAMFWALDGYFLRQEKLFRSLYDDVRKREVDDIDFSMDTSDVAKGVDGWFRVCRSTTLLLFHGAVFGSVIVVMLTALKPGGS